MKGYVKGIIIGASMGTGFSLIDKRNDRIVSNAIIGAIAGAVLLYYLDKKYK